MTETSAPVHAQNGDPLSLSVDTEPDGTRVLHLSGRLDAATAARIWAEALRVSTGGKRLVVDAAGLDYVDGAGLSLLLDLECQQRRVGGEFDLRQLKPGFQQLMDIARSDLSLDQTGTPPERPSIVVAIGQRAESLIRDLGSLVGYVGQMSQALFLGLINPSKVRWNDFLYTCTAAGVFALPVVCLIGFLLGWIMSFQASHIMHDYGADTFLAAMIGPAMVRELGALMTAVVLAARSGSAFAAEIGTMKVNEEVDALYTMGINPVRFLVTPKVLAAVVMTPLLAMFANVSGIVGGALVSMFILDLPLTIYVNQLQKAIDVGDVLGGLFKAGLFGVIVAAIGCIRGLQTRSSPTAVGISTTSAVVSGIVLIAVLDGLLAVVFQVLGI